MLQKKAKSKSKGEMNERKERNMKKRNMKKEEKGREGEGSALERVWFRGCPLLLHVLNPGAPSLLMIL